MLKKIEINSKALDYRIYVHKHFSKFDFDKWILDNLQLHKGLNVMDLGCGTGKHLFPISEIVGNEGTIVGIDISDESLNKCKKIIEDLKVKNIILCQADLVEIKNKMPNIGFDRVLSSFAIYYTKDKQKTFSDIYQSLKKNGQLFICGPTKRNNMEFLELVKKAGGSFSQDFLCWSEFLEKDAKKMIEKIFKNIKVRYFNNPIEFPDGDTLYQYWKSTPLYDVKIENKMKQLIQEEFGGKKRFVTNKIIIGLNAIKI